MTTRKPANQEKTPSASAALPAVRPMVAGIDIGSTQHWVCGPARADGTPNVRVFGTTTDQLHAMANWLEAQRVESVAMESTYVYWIPVYELLESRGLAVVLVNARQLHNVPGRKTDFSDCQWIQLPLWQTAVQARTSGNGQWTKPLRGSLRTVLPAPPPRVPTRQR